MLFIVHKQRNEKPRSSFEYFFKNYGANGIGFGRSGEGPEQRTVSKFGKSTIGFHAHEIGSGPSRRRRGRAQILVKPKKVGGSTMAGIIRRIGEKRGYWGYSNMLPIVWEPGVWANHAHLSTFWRHMWLLRRPSILIAWGRQPADRCLSSYYHFKVPSCPCHKSERGRTLYDGVRDLRARSLEGERTGRRR